MKKLLIFMLSACLLFSMAACSGGETQATGGVSYDAAENFTFAHKGTEITLHAPAAAIVSALGEPVKYTESTSCAFEGLDKSYYYGSFYLETYPKGEEDFVYGWWFADDSVSTPEGIYIGAAQTEVEKAYGADSFNGTNTYVVKKQAGTLTVIITDGVVSSIQYAINLD